MTTQMTRSKTAKLVTEPEPVEPEPDVEVKGWTTDDGDEGPSFQPPRAASSEQEMVTLLREFICAQRSREEILIGELQGLRTVMEADRASPSLTGVAVAASPTGHSLGGPSPLQQPALQSPQSVPVLRKDPKLLPFQSGEDIENFLLRFERVAKTWAWPETEWAYRLVPLLTGKALEAYSAMDEDLSDSYSDLKQALLTKFDISAETYGQRFRNTTVPQGETPTETYQCQKGLYRRWIKPDQCSVEDIGEVIVLEQLLRMFPPDVCTWVKEREPTTGLQAAKLATQYVNARQPQVTRTSQCLFHMGQENSRLEGQRVKNPGTWGPVGATRVEQQATVYQGAVGTNRFGHQVSSSRGEIICYYCQQPGHKASDCPIKKPKLSGYCYGPCNDDLNRQSTTTAAPGEWGGNVAVSPI
ncbi:uncharacterized protein LOC112149626 [Oryzias melastigma]|uniref:uncharacterized protein LOC112149626 n=1 Tax=Oryzias melastigma TaxID=30732 RepID=UPI000CF7D6E0|nr:uncharacterized protein LOC112149626 [Oryzias melastigma]